MKSVVCGVTWWRQGHNVALGGALALKDASSSNKQNPA